MRFQLQHCTTLRQKVLRGQLPQRNVLSARLKLVKFTFQSLFT